MSDPLDRLLSEPLLQPPADFTERARSIISEFPDSPYQRALTAVTDLVINRDR